MTLNIKPLDMKMARKYLSGIGYASKLMFDEFTGRTDALGPGNKIVFSTGVFTATGCPGSASLFIAFKSPLTNCWGEAHCSGGMGVKLKRRGHG